MGSSDNVLNTAYIQLIKQSFSTHASMTQNPPTNSDDCWKTHALQLERECTHLKARLDDLQARMNGFEADPLNSTYPNLPEMFIRTNESLPRVIGPMEDIPPQSSSTTQPSASDGAANHKKKGKKADGHCERENLLRDKNLFGRLNIGASEEAHDLRTLIVWWKRKWPTVRNDGRVLSTRIFARTTWIS